MTGRLRTVGRCLLGLFLVAAGVNHFWHPDPYVGIVPPTLPWPEAIVVVSGIAEIGIGLALFVAPLVRLAAWAAIALFIAVFPANVHMALHGELFPSIPVWLLWLRLPMQALLIAWAWLYTRPLRSGATTSSR